MKKYFFALVAGMAISATCFAQIHLGKFVDNWFVSGGAGVNTIVDNGTIAPVKPAIDLGFGKWLTPHTGLRLGYQGIANKAVDTSAGWFAGEDTFGFHYVHADIMWNPFKSQRLMAGPYFHSGVIMTTWSGNLNAEVGIGFGLWAQYKVAGNLSVMADVRPVFAREDAWRSVGKLICFPSATVGVSYAFGLGRKGKVGFELHKRDVEVVRVAEVMECSHAATIAALQAQLDSLRNQPAPEAKPVEFTYTVYFGLDKAEVTQREHFHLEDLVRMLPEDGVSISLCGHADKETGSHAHNDKLSRKRVENVVKELVKLGYHGRIPFVDYKGDAANPYGEPFIKNRCVVLHVTVEK